MALKQAPQLHAGESRCDLRLVHLLVTDQFPQWANEPIRQVDSSGTDNRIYRLGNKRLIRLPRTKQAEQALLKESSWLDYLAPFLPLPIPRPLAYGIPRSGFPHHWMICDWLDGYVAPSACDDQAAASSLADFLNKLHTVPLIGDPNALPKHERGGSLIGRDKETRQAIARLAKQKIVDGESVLSIWEQSLTAADWKKAPVWFHGDMLIGNILFCDNRLAAVIDFGCSGTGDPACDLMIAWSLFSGRARSVLNDKIKLDADCWRRARGHSIAQTVLYIDYYRQSNPVGVKHALWMLRQAIDDPVFLDK